MQTIEINPHKRHVVVPHTPRVLVEVELAPERGQTTYGGAVVQPGEAYRVERYVSDLEHDVARLLSEDDKRVIATAKTLAAKYYERLTREGGALHDDYVAAVQRDGEEKAKAWLDLQHACSHRMCWTYFLNSARDALGLPEKSDLPEFGRMEVVSLDRKSTLPLAEFLDLADSKQSKYERAPFPTVESAALSQNDMLAQQNRMLHQQMEAQREQAETNAAMIKALQALVKGSK